MSVQIVRVTEGFTHRLFPDRKEYVDNCAQVDDEEAIEQACSAVTVAVERMLSELRIGFLPMNVELFDSGMGFTVQKVDSVQDNSVETLLKLFKEVRNGYEDFHSEKILRMLSTSGHVFADFWAKEMRRYAWEEENPEEGIISESLTECGLVGLHEVNVPYAQLLQAAKELVLGHAKPERTKGADPQVVFAVKGFTFHLPEDKAVLDTTGEKNDETLFRYVFDHCRECVLFGYAAPVVELYGTGIGFTYKPQGDEGVTLGDILSEAKARCGSSEMAEVLDRIASEYRKNIKPAIDRMVGSYQESSEGSMEEYICKEIEYVYKKYFIMWMEEMQNVLMPLNDVGRRSWEAKRKKRKEYQSKVDNRVKGDREELLSVQVVETSILYRSFSIK